MVTIFLFFTLGIATGVLLRRAKSITFVHKLISATIVILLFSLGKSVGKNDLIINNLSTIGLQALVITSAAIAGSVLMSVIVYKYFFKDKSISNNSATTELKSKAA